MSYRIFVLGFKSRGDEVLEQTDFLRQNLDIIQPVLDSFSTLNQLWLKFVSCTGEYIFTPQKPQSAFCRFIRAHPEGFKRCRATTIRCANLNPNKFHLFTCHAGLIILAVPLHSEHGPLGALATGEIRLNPNWNENNEILKRTKDLNLNKEKLLKLFNEITIKKHEEILVFGNALYAISNCFLKLGTAFANLDHETSFTKYPLSRSQQLIQQAITHISQNYMKQISLEEVAKHVHVSPTYFSYLFSHEQGLTFSDFLTKIRLEKAKELLRNEPLLSIFQISQQIGYEDANYFSRVFKKVFGIPPSLYRKKRT